MNDYLGILYLENCLCHRLGFWLILTGMGDFLLSFKNYTSISNKTPCVRVHTGIYLYEFISVCTSVYMCEREGRRDSVT